MLSRVGQRGSGGGEAAALFESLWMDLRYAARSLVKRRGITAIVVATLALGIGANTAIFSIVHTMLIEPLPYRDSDRLVFVWLDRGAAGYPRGPLSGPDLGDLREGTRTFTGFGGIWASGTIALGGDTEPEQLRAAFVTTDFFQILGVDSVLGRTFRPEDSAPGAEPAILLGWDLFRRRFGADPSIVGRRIVVNDEPVTVIGVMPEHVRLLLPAEASVPDHLQAWVPFWPDLESGPRRNFFLRVIGRMRPGVTLKQAQDDVEGVARRISAETGNTRRTFATVALQAENVREIRGPLLTLFAGVGILLLIACVNVAGLLVARAASRGRETALRLALGASQWRLLRHLFAEGLLLTILGAAAGVICGYLVLQVLLALTPESLNRLAAARIDGTVLAFTLAVSIFWGVLCSLAPMTVLLKARAGGTLRPSGQTAAAHVRYGSRAALVVVQVALSLMLLVSAALLVRAFLEVVRVDPGFRAAGQLTFRLAIPGRYDSPEAFNAFARELQVRLAAIPGIASVGAISHLPYDDLPNWALTYGREQPLPTGSPIADSRAISTGLFETLGVQLVEGRFFTEDDDDPAHPVAIVNERLAREVWPDRSALGGHLVTSVAGMAASIGADHARLTVVGVVRHLKLRSVVEEMRPQIFVPWRIAQRNPAAWVVAAGTRGQAPASLTADVRAAVAALDPRLAIYDARPMQSYVDGARAMRRFTTLLAAAFAGSALALTLVGLYGVLAYAVAVRRPELGVRAALGADAARLRRLVIGEGVRLALAGCVGGLAAAALAARLLQSQLYAVHPRDPVSYVLAVAFVLGGVLVACWIPARRATRISPMEALRGE